MFMSGKKASFQKFIVKNKTGQELFHFGIIHFTRPIMSAFQCTVAINSEQHPHIQPLIDELTEYTAPCEEMNKCAKKLATELRRILPDSNDAQ